MTPRNLDAATSCATVTVWWRLCAPHPGTGGPAHDQRALCRSQHIFVCAGGHRGDSLAYTCVGDPGNALTCNDGYHVRALLVRLSVRVSAGLTSRVEALERKLCMRAPCEAYPSAETGALAGKPQTSRDYLLFLPERLIIGRLCACPAPAAVRARLSYAESCVKIEHAHQHGGQ